MFKQKVLVVDDEQGVRNTLTSILEDEGYSVDSVESGEDCLNALNREKYQAVLLDVWLPGIDGVETLKRMRSMGAEAAVVMISGHGTVETAVKATKLGAFDFIEKPLSLEKIMLVLKNAIRHKKLLEKHKILEDQLRKDISLIGNSNAMNQLRRDIETVAPTDSPVFIIGERGSGKEHAARLIHSQSQRSEEAFISINCAAFEGELLEHELFGFEKGIFPWASQGKKGKFELANEGTIFLDEITDASGKTQTQILKVLEEKSYNLTVSDRLVRTDVRVIAASMTNPQEIISTGKLREELIYKLNVVTLLIPPLRERQEDIVLLMEHFLKEFSREYGRSMKTPAREALDILNAYPWPGNVRELKNTIERLVIMLKKGTIEPSDLPDTIRQEKAVANGKEYKPLPVALSEFEKKYIQEILQFTQYDFQKASEIMKVDPQNLEKKIKLYGIKGFNLLDR